MSTGKKKAAAGPTPRASCWSPRRPGLCARRARYVVRTHQTCGACRRQHLRCHFSARDDTASAAAHERDAPVRCTRCEQRGVECTPVGVSISRYYPRPSRTGRRIELGRQLHGSTVYAEAPDASSSSIPSETQAQRALSWPRIYLRMIHCFFCYSHIHFPIVVYERIAHAFNLAYGDPRLMAQYMNGPSLEEEHPVFCGGTEFAHLHRGSGAVECTTETMEVLLVVILAWAAHHIELPFESLDPGIFAQMGTTSLVDAIVADPGLGFKRVLPSAARSAHPGDGDGAKRPHKRRQGVACDTCRLRRVRCDLMEQPTGSKACSRCRVKGIVCTDRYIQWKQQRDLQKRPAGGAGGSLSLPVAVTCVRLLPEIYEFEETERLSPAVRKLSQQELLEYGAVRENVCSLLINRALMLVHKYNLQHVCNMQSAQALVLLAGLLDYSRPDLAYDAQRVSVSHMRSLVPYVHIDLAGIETPAVAQLRLREVFVARAQITTWTRDAIFNVSHQRAPQLQYDWFLLGERKADVPDSAAPREKMHMLGVSELKKYFREDIDESIALLFVFCSTAHLGKIAHKVYRDVIVPLHDQQAFPTLADVERIAKACHALWEDLATVELAHRFFAQRAKKRLYQVRVMNVLHWTTMVYMLMFVLYQALSRRLRDWFTSNSSHIARGNGHPEGRDRVLEAMRRLFQESQDRTLCLCRVVAHHTGNLLETGLLHRASSLTRQLFRVAQYLARSHPVDGKPEPGARSSPHQASGAQRSKRLDFMLNPSEGRTEPQPPPSHTPSGKANLPFDPELVLNVPYSGTLEPFTREAKRREVDWCVEGLGQVGFAYTGLDTEIRRVVDIVHAMS